MKRVFVCPSFGTSDEITDKVLDEVRPFSEEVYIREFYADKTYKTVLGITHSGRAMDLDLEWGKYTELAHALIGVEKCDGVIFCGKIKDDIVSAMLFVILKMHDSDFGEKDVYLFNGDKLVKV